MMKRSAVAVCLGLALTLTLSGCARQLEAPVQQLQKEIHTVPATPPIKIETEGAVAYTVLPEAEWPPELADAVRNLTSGQKAPLHDAWRVGDFTYLIVFGGELPSEEYQVVFDAVDNRSGVITVAAHVEGPSNPASSKMSRPVGVARMARHDGQVTFTIAPLTQANVDPGPAPVKTGTVPIDLRAMKNLQAQVDQGHQPWRLDPLQVAMAEGRQYGLDPAAGDKFVMLAPVTQGKPSGQARVEVRHGGQVYVVELIQPNGPSPTGIWTINAIRLAQ
ncbi:MAG TPA: hypothetical protein VK464_25630 [Symbiobacteriaceae bacterium]|jgi:hypothetical protein|nr:hypothetical protein [Symbiobacteriaceae bacterium]